MRVATRTSPGYAGADHTVAGEDFTTAGVKGSLRRPPAALDPRLLRRIDPHKPEESQI
jgi:hypothetical protein